jgi:hypothetical protein
MRSFSLAILLLWSSIIGAEAGYLPLLHAGMGVGAAPAPTFVLQTDGASYILLVDGVSKLQKAQP